MNVRAILSLILTLVMVAPAGAQAPAGGMTIEDLRVIVGKSLVIDYPADINRISTSNPDVVDAVPATSREFLLHGKGHGAATVVVWAKNGMRTMYNVTVEHNLDPIRGLLKSAFPNENVQIQAGRDSVALTGVVSSKEIAERMVAATTPLAKSVVNNLAVASPAVGKQILLRVRFAELNRTAAQQFGVNLVSTGAGNTIGSAGTQQFNSTIPSALRGGIPARLQGATANFAISDALNIFAFRPDLNLAGFLRALENQGVLQILAEPNLVTTNGREASFLAGGEFPVPVLQGGGNAGAVTIQFREFGIRLSFLPQLTDNSTIKLYVKPEVSTLDLANAVTISGFTIPALATKRMETNIELGTGQSFVIAGLIDDRVNETFNKLPGLANIPILGALFRSRSISKSKQELVVIVTPELASPLNPSDKKPEPTWIKEFMPKLNPGDKTGMEIVPGRPDRVAGEAAKTPGAPKADATQPSADPAQPKAGKKFLFWGKGKEKEEPGKAVNAGAKTTNSSDPKTDDPKTGEPKLVEPKVAATEPAPAPVPPPAAVAEPAPAEVKPAAEERKEAPAEVPAEKAAEKPAEKLAEKPEAKPVEKPAEKPVEAVPAVESKPAPVAPEAADPVAPAAKPVEPNPAPAPSAEAAKPGAPVSVPAAVPVTVPVPVPPTSSPVAPRAPGITSLPASLRAATLFRTAPAESRSPVQRAEVRAADAQ